MTVAPTVWEDAVDETGDVVDRCHSSSGTCDHATSPWVYDSSITISIGLSLLSLSDGGVIV